MPAQYDFWTTPETVNQIYGDIRELSDLINAYPEWLIYGTWDTPRCMVCKGFQHRGGHKKNCKRERYERNKNK
jgi:hypothetical protein